VSLQYNPDLAEKSSLLPKKFLRKTPFSGPPHSRQPPKPQGLAPTLGPFPGDPSKVPGLRNPIQPQTFLARSADAALPSANILRQDPMASDGAHESKPRPCLGFLTVLECPQDGLFGGYLALDFRGRPLEFHCTAPIRPNRAQQILYGPTLEDYLYGEQIGQTLLKASQRTPLAVFTDRHAVLAVRDLVDLPVALVDVSGNDETPVVTFPAKEGFLVAESDAKKWHVHASHLPDVRLNHFQLGRNRVATSARADADQSTIAQRLADLADSFDLAEPFVRIREAIEEARRSGGS
jgi:hypothetical protein